MSNGAAYSAGRHAGGHGGVPQPGAVEVQRAGRARSQNSRTARDVLERDDDAAAVIVRVLERRPPRVGAKCTSASVCTYSSIFSRSSVPSGESKQRSCTPASADAAALLVEDDVRLGVQEDLVAAPRVRAQAAWLAIVPEGKKSAASLPSRLGGLAPRGGDRGIVAEDVVADLGLGHRAAASSAGPGHRVAAQVDARGHPLFPPLVWWWGA